MGIEKQMQTSLTKSTLNFFKKNEGFLNLNIDGHICLFVLTSFSFSHHL